MPLSQPAKIPGFTVGNIQPINPIIGDIWIERDNVQGYKNEWFWNGSYWLSTNNYIGATASLTNLSSNSNGARLCTQAFGLKYNVFLSSLNYSVYPTATQDVNNYWAIQVAGISPRGTPITIVQDNTILFASQVKPSELYLNKSLAVNTLLNFNTGSSYPNIQIYLTKIGSPAGGCYLHASLVCNLARQ
jgi:hypothetical protein